LKNASSLRFLSRCAFSLAAGWLSREAKLGWRAGGTTLRGAIEVIDENMLLEAMPDFIPSCQTSEPEGRSDQY
jgi:hypothetical protein